MDFSNVDDDDAFFNEIDAPENSQHFQSSLATKTSFKSGFCNNLAKVDEETLHQQSIHTDRGCEEIFDLDMSKAKLQRLSKKSIDEFKEFSFKTGEQAIEYLNSNRNRTREFLRLDPFLSYNATHYTDEMSWEREARAGNLSNRLATVEKSSNDQNLNRSQTDLPLSVINTNLKPKMVQENLQTPEKNYNSLIEKCESFGLSQELHHTPVKTVSTEKCQNFTTNQDFDQMSAKSACNILTKKNQAYSVIQSFHQTPKKTNQNKSSIPINNTIKKQTNFSFLNKPQLSSTSINVERFKNNLNSVKDGTFATHTTFMDSPTFVLNCTSRNGQNILEADRPILYFGFRPLHSQSEDAIGFINKSDKPVNVVYKVFPPSAVTCFKLYYTKETIKTLGKSYVNIEFCPTSVQKAKAQLRVDCTTNDGQSFKYKIDMLGFGGQAFVRPLSVGANKIKVSSTGRYQLMPKSLSFFSLSFENIGERDAFVSVILQDVNGEEIPSENACIFPANFVLKKSKEVSQKVDFRLFMQSNNLMNVGSQQSLVSISKMYSTRPSSAMDYTTSNNTIYPPICRILVFWGEEKQRQRIKTMENNKQNIGSKERIKILGRHLLWSYEGEQTTDSSADKLLSPEDYRLFKSYIRYDIIDVLGKRMPLSSRNSTARAITGNTLIEMEPDNTLKIGDSMYSAR